MCTVYCYYHNSGGNNNNCCNDKRTNYLAANNDDWYDNCWDNNNGWTCGDIDNNSTYVMSVIKILSLSGISLSELLSTEYRFDFFAHCFSLKLKFLFARLMSSQIRLSSVCGMSVYLCLCMRCSRYLLTFELFGNIFAPRNSLEIATVCAKIWERNSKGF